MALPGPEPLRLLLLITALLCACQGRPPEHAGASSPPEATNLAEGENTGADELRSGDSPLAADLTLPTLNVGSPLPDSMLPLVIGPGVVWIGTTQAPVVHLPSREVQAREGFGIEKRQPALRSYVVRPLASALSEAACSPPPPLAIYADALAPYQVVLETVMTARHLGFEQILLVGKDADGQHVHVELQGSTDGPEFAIALLPGDAELTLSGGERAGDECKPGVSALVVPRRNGTYDYAEARRCLDAYAGKSDIVVRVGAAPSTPLHVLLDAANALMEEASGPRRLAVLVPGEPTPTSAARAAEGPTSESLQNSAQDAVAVVEGLREDFRACYRTSLLTDPESAGTIKLTLRIDGDGSVSEMEAIPTGSLGPEVLQCVQTAAAPARFQPPEGGKAVIVLPIRFVRSDVEEARPHLRPCGTARPAAR